jgi:hypothetical protein
MNFHGKLCTLYCSSDIIGKMRWTAGMGEIRNTVNILVRKLNRMECMENMRIDENVIWTLKEWVEQAWT